MSKQASRERGADILSFIAFALVTTMTFALTRDWAWTAVGVVVGFFVAILLRGRLQDLIKENDC